MKHCKLVHIAVIDDGVNEKRYGTGTMEYNIEITRDLQVRDRFGADLSASSHGTTCAAIIKKYSPQARLSSVKILGDNTKGLKEQLIKAINWCVDHDIRLIHLSVGTIHYFDFQPLRKAVNRAYKNGVIIVAACSNDNVVTYPASLSNTIGVKADVSSTLKEGEYIYHPYPSDGIEITACARHFITDCFGKGRNTSLSNSFAAPMITALVNSIMVCRPDISLEEIKKQLNQYATHPTGEWYCPYLSKSIDWLEKAVVLNVGGEIALIWIYQWPLR